MRVADFPVPGSKVSASDFIVTGGGCAANAALAAARLGAQVRFAGPLGGSEDAASDRIVSDLVAEGVDCSGVVRVTGASASVSLILLDARGEKSIATRRGHGLNAALPANTAGLVKNVDALLVDNRFPEFALAVARAAKAQGIPVVIDLDMATRPDDPLLALGDYVIASSEALAATAGTGDFAAGLSRLAAYNSGLLAVTDGANGVFWREGARLRHMPAFAVEAIDTLGAGDAFHGAFTVAIAEQCGIETALRFACAAAALKCMRFGGGAGAPGRAAVDEFIKARAAS